ncbi:MAG: LysR family transcriptional regulator [Myxococcota bacterium]
MNDWDLLRLFLEVAQQGTLSAAAHEAGVSVATVQRRIASLEEELGTPLFYKGPRGYRLTVVGEVLLPRAQDVSDAVLAARRAVAGNDAHAAGELRVTLPSALLPAVACYFAEFARAHADVRLRLLADDHSLSLERDTDVALRATTSPPESAVGARICDLAWGHYASTRPPDDDASEELPWIHYDERHGSPAVAWRRSAFPDIVPLWTVQSVSDMRTALAAVASQGVLPCFVGDAEPRLRRIDGPLLHDQLWVLMHRDLRRAGKVRAFVDFFTARLRQDRARFERSPEA